jgi:hypothetical protein
MLFRASYYTHRRTSNDLINWVILGDSSMLHLWYILRCLLRWLTIVLRLNLWLHYWFMLILSLGCRTLDIQLRWCVIFLFIFIHLGYHGGSWCRGGRVLSPFVTIFLHLLWLDVPNGHVLQGFNYFIITYILIANNLPLGGIRFIKPHITCFFN